MYGKNEQFYVICLYFMSFFWKKFYLWNSEFSYWIGFSDLCSVWSYIWWGWFWTSRGVDSWLKHWNPLKNQLNWILLIPKGSKNQNFSISKPFLLIIFSNFLFLQVRTLFVSGLPMDAKPRELYLLFRAYEGYEGSLLKVTSKNGKTASVSFLSYFFLIE